MTPPINPTTHQTIHPPMGGIVSTDFKSSNRIEISWLVQVLLNFYWFWGSPMGDEGWVDVSLGWCTCTCTCMHTHTCMCIWHHRESLGFPKSNGGNHLQLKLSCLTCICACVCMHACVCICTCVGVPLNHPTPLSTHPPELQGAQNTKIQ